MKTIAKSVLCATYKYSGLMAVQEKIQFWSGRRFLAILLFHRVTDAIPPDGLTVSTSYFRNLCRMLQRNFRVVSLAEAMRILKKGEIPHPRTVAITFDDCYRDNLFAARVLAEFGLPACFFVPTGFVDTDHVFEWDRHLPPMPNLTWDDCREMLTLGHQIGSHSATHPDMGKISVDRARLELAESKEVLETRLGCPARWFAYPYGGPQHFKKEFLPLVYEQGYEACLSAQEGFIFPRRPRQLLPRVSLPCFPSLLNLELHLSGCLDWWYNFKKETEPCSPYPEDLTPSISMNTEILVPPSS